MSDVITIRVKKEALQALKKSKEYPRQTYNELILRMAEAFRGIKKRNQYDEFLHKIQQPKMKELWGNKEDEIYETLP